MRSVTCCKQLHVDTSSSTHRHPSSSQTCGESWSPMGLKSNSRIFQAYMNSSPNYLHRIRLQRIVQFHHTLPRPYPMIPVVLYFTCTRPDRQGSRNPCPLRRSSPWNGLQAVRASSAINIALLNCSSVDYQFQSSTVWSCRSAHVQFNGFSMAVVLPTAQRSVCSYLFTSRSRPTYCAKLSKCVRSYKATRMYRYHNDPAVH